MAAAATSPELQSAIEAHHSETQMHAERLEQIFMRLSEDADGETCEAMQGLITEGNEFATAIGNPEIRDAGIIAAAQRVEHYEISAYGSARALAQRLGFHDDAELFQTTLEEEKKADSLLNEIAGSHVNEDAQASSLG